MAIPLTAAETLDQAPPSRRLVISVLGTTQIFAWGSSFYLSAVLAKPIVADTGWSFSWIMGGVSLGLLVAGLVSPRVGRAIGQQGGRRVMSASSILLGIGLLVLGLAPNIAGFLAAWIILGLGMGCGLYDAAFGTLGRYYGSEARSAITTLTLWGGFASTVCWPISAFMVDHWGWRTACFVYAAIQVLLALPAHLVLLPSVHRPVANVAEKPRPMPVTLAPAERPAFYLMAGIVTLGGAVSSLFSMHLLTLLQDRNLTLAAAVSLGALVGPSQVGARVVEMAFGKHYHPVWTMVSAILLVASGLVLLAIGFPILAIALVLYGGGNGIYSIARGTVPLRLFGPDLYPSLMGRLAMPSLLAQAAMPSIGALVLDHGGTGMTFGLLVAMAGCNVVLVLALRLVCRTS